MSHHRPAGAETRACLGLLLLAGCSVPAEAPSSACPACRIEVTPIVTLGQHDDSDYLPADPWGVVQDSRGQYIVAVPEQGAERLWVFDREGHFVGKFAPHGEGPGEMLSVRLLTLAPGDTLFAYEESRGLRMVFDPERRFVRSEPVPSGIASTLLLGDGSRVDMSVEAPPGRYGLPFHRYDRDGRLIAEFGDSLPYLPRDPARGVWWLGPASNPDAFWTAPWTYRYRLERWSADGERERVIEPASPVYPPYDKILISSPQQPPLPALYGVWEDADGVVWTSLMVAAPDWHRGLGAMQRSEGQDVWPQEDMGQVYDGVIEAFDATTGERLASVRIPEPYHFRLSSDLIAGVRWDSDGLPSIAVARVRLIGRPAPMDRK